MRLPALLFILANVFATLRAADPGYEKQLAAARQYAAESSWAKARESYEAARKLAPDDMSRRMCDLGSVDAGWRSEDAPANWQERENQQNRVLPAYDSLLKPYPDTPARDDLWASIMESRAAFFSRHERERAWSDWLAIADYLGGKPPSADTAAQYICFLERIAETDPLPESVRYSLKSHLQAGLRAAPDREAQVRLRLLIALRLTGTDNLQSQKVSPFAEIIEIAKGTSAEAIVRAWDFVWRSEHHPLSKKTADDTPDFPAWLAELARVRAELPKTPTTTKEKAAIDALEEKARAWTAPLVLMETPRMLVPGEPLAVEYGAAGHTSITFRLYRHSLESWRRVIKNRNYNTKVSSLGAILLQTWTVPLSKTQNHAWETGRLQISAAIPGGFYSLTVDGNADPQSEMERRIDITVSNTGAVVLKGEHSDAIAYVFDQKTKEPLANTEIEFASTDSKAPPVSVKTDAVGCASLQHFVSGDEPSFDSQLLLLAGGSPVSVSTSDYNFRNQSKPTEVINAGLILDRPIYRPGDTVNWKLVVRNDDGLNYSLPTKALRLFVRLNDETLLDGQKLALSRFGTAHGQFTIPSSARPGHAEVKLSFDEKSQRYISGFTVDNIVPPASKAEIVPTSARDSLRPGSTARFKVRAAYLSGGPVIGAPVKLEIALFAFNRDEKDNNKKAIDDWIEKESAPRSSSTDANGCAEFALTIPSWLSEEKIFGRIKAAVLPQGAPPIAADSELKITNTGYVVAEKFRESPRWTRPNVPVEIKYQIEDGFGYGCPFEGKAEIIELRWAESWLDAENNIATPAEVTAKRSANTTVSKELLEGWTRLFGRYTEHKTATLPVSADDDGVLRVSFDSPHSGCFAIRILSGNHPVTPKTIAEPRIIVADENTRTLQIEPDKCLLLRDTESPAAPGRLLAIFPDGKTEGVFAVTDRIRTTMQRVSLKGRCGILTIPHTTGASTAMVAPLGFVTYDLPRILFNNKPANPISFEILPRTKENRPGETVTVLLRTTASGLPAPQSEICLAATDEALYRVFPNGETMPRFARHSPDITIIEDSSAWNRTWLERQMFLLRNAGPLVDPRMSGWDSILSAQYAMLQDRGGAFGGLACASLAGLADSMDTSAQINVRRFFSSTACWEPTIITDAKGEALVTFKYPDNLTQWRLSAYAVGEDLNSFGSAKAFTRTALPFQARLQLPRFLVAGDHASASAVLVNRSETDLSAQASLSIAGAASLTAKPALRSAIPVARQNEVRTDWNIKADQPGTARIALTARAGSESDAMELPLPILEDGVEQHTAANACLAGDKQKTSFTLSLPAQLDPARTRVTVELNAGHAGALLDALPYLVDYPYGCVEQTTSRFLPAVVVRETLRRIGMPADVVEKRIQATETPADAARRAKTAGLAKLDEVIAQSLSRLADAQHSNGGFGWWPGAQNTDPWMTGYVAWGLAQAKAAGVTVPKSLLAKTTSHLFELVGPFAPDKNLAAWGLVAALQTKIVPKNTDPTALGRAFEAIYAKRDTLSASGRACLALAAKKLNRTTELSVLLRNLENGAIRVQTSDLGDTVHWGGTGGHWRAVDGSVETTALTLLALIEADPGHPLVNPAINWLLLNRRSAHWTNSRDTAFALLALARSLELLRELDPEGEIELLANGALLQRIKFSREALLKGSTSVTIPASKLKPEKSTFTIRRLSGKSTIHAVAHSSAWAQSASIRPASHLIGIGRGLSGQKAQSTLRGTLRLTHEPLTTSNFAALGEQVTATLTLSAPNELEYLMIEVPKPAGCEPLNPLSGWDATIERVDETQNTNPASDLSKDSKGTPVYREERDDKSIFFLDHLPAGKWRLRFALRAITSGDFRVLPATIQAMYAPEICANTEATRVKIEHAE